MTDVITDNLDVWSAALLQKSTRGRSANRNRGAYGINKLRKLILKLAVRGEIAPQDPNDEPASALLKTIADENESLFKSCFHDGKSRADTDTSGKETAIVAQTPASGLNNECATQIEDLHDPIASIQQPRRLPPAPFAVLALRACRRIRHNHSCSGN